jgi:wyosine [tRNA(Phe)-imidazoG37] synthetase (radical SAM superfamily)
MMVYGPVPSRRLGRSLGINHLPPKTCSYACVYCQVGRTSDLRVDRRPFHGPRTILDAVRRRTDEVRSGGETIDYLSFVPDGEPSLDIDLGETIVALRELGMPIAVISNGSLIARPDVRLDLAAADWVSLKLDTVDPAVWRRLNRPHGACDLTAIERGLLAFREEFTGTLATETMLVAGLNDSRGHAAETAAFLARLRPDVAYISVPTRPPARRNVRAAAHEVVVDYHETFAERVARVECLLGYEGDAFTSAGDARRNLLSITAVHPMRRQAVLGLLERAGAGWDLVENLVEEGELTTATHDGHQYVLRRFRREPS